MNKIKTFSLTSIIFSSLLFFGNSPTFAQEFQPWINQEILEENYRSYCSDMLGNISFNSVINTVIVGKNCDALLNADSNRYGYYLQEETKRQQIESNEKIQLQNIETQAKLSLFQSIIAPY